MKPAAATSAPNASRAVTSTRLAAGGGEPAQPPGFVLAGPQARVARPEAAGPALDGRPFPGRGHGVLEVGRERDRLGVLLRSKRLGPLARDRGVELVGRVRELLDAVLDQPVGDRLQVEPEPLDRLEHRLGLLDPLGQRRRDAAVVAEGVDGLRRHGVDRVAPDQGLDVEHVGVGGVLRPRRRPQQPLRGGAGGEHRLPPRRRDHLEVSLVGDLGVGDRDLAPQRGERVGRRVAGLDPGVDGVVDLGVDAADEEAGDAGDQRDVAAAGVQSFQAREVGFRHGQIGVEPEQQRDVDVDPLADQLADGGRAGLGAGNLDHQIRPIDRAPEPPRLGDGPQAVHGQVRRDLEADEAVAAVQAVVDRAQLVGRLADVGDGQLVEQAARIGVAVLQHVLDRGVVVGAVADRFLEDGGVGGDALDAVLLDEAHEVAVREDAALDEIEPDSLASLAELKHRIGHRSASRSS